MPTKRHLRLSLHAVPEVSIGLSPLTPENSGRDPRRLDYLDGMAAYLNQLFRARLRQSSRAEALATVRAIAARLPDAGLLSISDSDRPVTPRQGARDRIAFDQERLTIAFLDGLHRSGQCPVIAVGQEAPKVAHLVTRLVRGVTEEELAELQTQGAVDLSGAVSGLRELGLIETVDPEETPVPAALRSGEGDRLAWLGHAGMLYQTPRATLCVDPYLRPHLEWTPREKQEAFSPEFADRHYFEPYDAGVQPLSPAELPPLDAIFVTHQDIDHCNLGVLMMLPEDVPIVVPDWDPDHPWEVDLAGLIRRVLGPDRQVVRLKHGESLRIGDVTATAFPFLGEMPTSLSTRWNCYLFETEHSAVAMTADSAVTDLAVEFLAGSVSRRKPLVLCSRPVHAGGTTPGYRDETEELYNFSRLWAWYVPVWDLFHPAERPGISEACLERLAERTDLNAFHPYAMGTAPWYRLPDSSDPLYVPLGNLSARELDGITRVLDALPQHTRLFPGRFAEPVPLAVYSGAQVRRRHSAA